MKKIIIGFILILLTGCATQKEQPFTVCPAKETYIVPNVPVDFLTEVPLPHEREWNNESLQGDDVGQYIIELNLGLETANGKIKGTKEFLEKIKKNSNEKL